MSVAGPDEELQSPPAIVFSDGVAVSAVGMVRTGFPGLKEPRCYLAEARQRKLAWSGKPRAITAFFRVKKKGIAETL